MYSTGLEAVSWPPRPGGSVDTDAELSDRHGAAESIAELALRMERRLRLRRIGLECGLASR